MAGLIRLGSGNERARAGSAAAARSLKREDGLAAAMPRYVLRRATLDDLLTLVAHRRAMFEAMGPRAEADLRTHDRAFRAWARSRLRSGELVAWIVEAAGAPVASGCAWRRPTQPRPGWTRDDQPYLMGMFTAPAHRGRGLARRIVLAATKWARAEGYPRFTLHASEMGRGLYAALGWERSWEMKLDLTRRKAPGRGLRAATRPSPGRSPKSARRSPPRPARRRSTAS